MKRQLPLKQRPITAVRRPKQIIVPNRLGEFELSDEIIYPKDGPLFEVVLDSAQQCEDVLFPDAVFGKSYRLYVDRDGVTSTWDFTMVDYHKDPDKLSGTPFFSAHTDAAPDQPVTLSNWYMREIIGGIKPRAWQKPPGYCGYDA